LTAATGTTATTATTKDVAEHITENVGKTRAARRPCAAAHRRVDAGMTNWS